MALPPTELDVGVMPFGITPTGETRWWGAIPERLKGPEDQTLPGVYGNLGRLAGRVNLACGQPVIDRIYQPVRA